MLHPSIKILCVIALAAAVQLSDYRALLAMAGLLAMFLLYYRAAGFWKMLRRVRWLLLTLLLIFAFNTPGEYIQQWPFELAPTYEGLTAGLLQSARLCIMLAGLSLLLANTNRENLIAGFFLLLYPLRYLKLSPERFAARLWLTLHYVEQGDVEQAPRSGIRQGMFDQFHELNMDDDNSNHEPKQIQLIVPRLTWRDALVIVCLGMAGIYLL